MMSSKKCGVIVGLLVLTVAARAGAQTAGGSSTGKSGGEQSAVAVPAEVSESPTRLVRGAACVTLAGRALTLRADTTILEPGQWEALDVALRSTQTAETRLAAENRSLRASADGSRWGSVWPVLVALAAGGGIGAGIAAYELR